MQASVRNADACRMRTVHRRGASHTLAPGTDLRVLHNRNALQQHHSVFRREHASKRTLVSTQFLYKMSLFCGGGSLETKHVGRVFSPDMTQLRVHDTAVTTVARHRLVYLAKALARRLTPPTHTLKTAPQWLKRPRDEVRQCEDRPAVTVCALPQPFASAGVSVQGEDARDAAPSRITAA